MKPINIIFFLLIICVGCNQQPKEQAKKLFEQISVDMESKSYQDAIRHIDELIELVPNVVEYQQMKIAIQLEAGDVLMIPQLLGQS